MKNKIIGLMLAVLVVAVIGYLYTRDGSVKRVHIGGQTVKVRLASTQVELKKGLAGTTHLNWDQGMLFLFPVAGQYQFWMKDMVIPLDIVWIRGTTITQITEDVPPPKDLQHQDNLPLYASSELVDTVLELPAGFVARYQVKVGDTVRYN
jgi:uncharacterized membrane protein (UPF0127 family)